MLLVLTSNKIFFFSLCVTINKRTKNYTHENNLCNEYYYYINNTITKCILLLLFFFLKIRKRKEEVRIENVIEKKSIPYL